MNTDKRTEFASASYTAGQLNAMVKLIKKQAGEDGPNRFLSGELTISETLPKWREEDGVIYFSVTSDGTTGEEWIQRLECKEFGVSDYANEVLCSTDFKPTDGVTTEIAVLKGMLFKNNERTTRKIHAEADKRELTKPNAEVACLIRKKFMNKELKAMGLLYIVEMHEPIRDCDGSLVLLSVDCNEDGRWLDVCHDRRMWPGEYGFAFAVSQSSSLS